MNVDCIRFGRDRESALLLSITENPYIFRSQLQAQHKLSQRMAQLILTRMVKKCLIARFRPGSRLEYIYYIPPKSNKWRHYYWSNIFDYSLKKQLKSWQKILMSKREIKHTHGISDMFYALQTTIDGGGRKFFVEIDIEKRNKFVHVQNYNKTFEDKSWHMAEWANVKGKLSFPIIVVITNRPHIIAKTIEKENAHKLTFKIGTIDQMQKNIWEVLK